MRYCLTVFLAVVSLSGALKPVPPVPSGVQDTPLPRFAQRGVNYYPARNLDQALGGNMLDAYPDHVYDLIAFRRSVTVQVGNPNIVTRQGDKRMMAAPIYFQGKLYVPVQYLYQMGCDISSLTNDDLVAACPTGVIFRTSVVRWE